MLNQKKESDSVTDKLKSFYKKELELNGAPKDKNTFDDLRKKSWFDEDIKLNENSRSMTKRVLQDVMKDNGYEVPDGISSKAKSSAETEGVVGEFLENTGSRITETVTGEKPDDQKTGNF